MVRSRLNLMPVNCLFNGGSRACVSERKMPLTGKQKPQLNYPQDDIPQDRGLKVFHR